jgi:hypothetical protein
MVGGYYKILLPVKANAKQLCWLLLEPMEVAEQSDLKEFR